MSLYYDAASILSSSDLSGSLKSRLYAKDSNLKSKPAHLYALISETAKYDTFLKEVIGHADILSLEQKLNPLLALLLVHDHLFAKRGIAAAASHPLRQTIERHKARLQSEFTKARLRRKIATVEQLKAHLVIEKGHVGRVQPRWTRVNLIKPDIPESVKKTLASYEKVDELDQVITTTGSSKVFYEDGHIPDLLAFAPDEELTKSQAYLNGDIILQDKASCFPAYLLLGDQSASKIGDVMDGCAAPGNKTTHLAAIMSEIHCEGKIFACERDPTRSKTLEKMVEKAGASKIVDVLQKQDFLALVPSDEQFANVTHILLDPSCSGSGIMRREDIPKLALPEDPRAKKSVADQKPSRNSKKRKREPSQRQVAEAPEAADLDAESEAQPIPIDQSRLQKLSNLQTHIVEHALSFPAAERITYSTCSIHIEENEAVVERVLKSEAAKKRGWRVMTRDEQVKGMKEWKHRGIKEHPGQDNSSRVTHSLTESETNSCIRCSPEDGEGTMGFFVCAFIRDHRAIRKVDPRTYKYERPLDEDPDAADWPLFGSELDPNGERTYKYEQPRDEDIEGYDWDGFSDG